MTLCLASIFVPFLGATLSPSSRSATIRPDPVDVAGFNTFFERYPRGLAIERAALQSLG